MSREKFELLWKHFKLIKKCSKKNKCFKIILKNIESVKSNNYVNMTTWKPLTDKAKKALLWYFILFIVDTIYWQLVGRRLSDWNFHSQVLLRPHPTSRALHLHWEPILCDHNSTGEGRGREELNRSRDRQAHQARSRVIHEQTTQL